jgi:hypothetical protein
LKLYHALLSCVAVSALFLNAGCAEPVDGSDDADDDGADLSGAPVEPVRSMKINNEAKPGGIVNQAAQTLSYYGGPVIQHVNVIPIYWTAGVANQSQLNAYYAGVTNSVYFDWLSEYNTASPAQSIGRGTAQAGYVDNASTSQLTETKIQAELKRLFDNNLVAKPNANNYYAIHFPLNTSIKASDGSRACVQWCAFHSTMV